MGTDPFAIFLGPNQVSGSNVSEFYFGYDDQIMTGFATMAHSREESEETMAQLIHSGGEVTRGTE